MRHRVAARFTTALALVAASLAWALPAQAAVEGFDVNIGQQPGTFTIEQNARTLTAVVTTDRDGRCRKVRWLLTIRTDGVNLDQLRINRVENGGQFRVRSEVDGDVARVVDEQSDPGELCRGRTVTGRWDIGFTGPDSGTVTFAAAALDARGRELAVAETTSRVVSPVAATPSPTPEEEAAEEDAAEEDAAAGEAPAGDEPTSAALDPAAGTPSLLGPGLIIGAVLVFLGVALLLRLRTRNRPEQQPAWQAHTQTLPTGFYPPPANQRRRRR
ncbi:hypothetical protein [Paractinoplanes rishiriensis]|uniref:Uncharacterized protein n=1 Tax=Paractinoplanes rishiriensis TaxID=1050105 RepID=A0A919MZS1_9ACTN|nr:hypothetical protein [Actinoplanes rishiriensis]GIF01889.1 hypothetical protein Ari01nite_93530 [Actinoplanes rishiriensis]